MEQPTFIQLITEDETYKEDTVETYLTTLPNQISKVVGIVGPQSSGKSSLFNRAFKTRFQVMDMDRGYSQTTKGAMLAEKDGLLLLDMEGSDSRERDIAGQRNFENRAALFALAISDVFIVNVWTNELGRATGSRELLRIVIENYFPLLTIKEKKKCVVLLRDFPSKTQNVQAYKDQAMNFMREVWENTERSSEFSLGSLEDYFDLHTVPIRYNPNEGEIMKEDIDTLVAKVHELADSIENFLPLKKIPLLWKSIWTKISNNEDLNVPTLKEIIATGKCEKVLENIKETSIEMMNELRELSRKDFINVKSEDIKLTQKFLDKFENKCDKYAKSVYSKHRDELAHWISDKFEPIYENQRNMLETRSNAKVVSLFEEWVELIFSYEWDEVRGHFEYTSNDFIEWMQDKSYESKSDLVFLYKQSMTKILEIVEASKLTMQLKLENTFVEYFWKPHEEVWHEYSLEDIQQIFDEIYSLTYDKAQHYIWIITTLASKFQLTCPKLPNLELLLSKAIMNGKYLLAQARKQKFIYECNQRAKYLLTLTKSIDKSREEEFIVTMLYEEIELYNHPIQIMSKGWMHKDFRMCDGITTQSGSDFLKYLTFCLAWEPVTYERRLIYTPPEGWEVDQACLVDKKYTGYGMRTSVVFWNPHQAWIDLYLDYPTSYKSEGHLTIEMHGKIKRWTDVVIETHEKRQRIVMKSKDVTQTRTVWYKDEVPLYTPQEAEEIADDQVRKELEYLE